MAQDIVIILPQRPYLGLNVFTTLDGNALDGFDVPYLNLSLQCFCDIVGRVGCAYIIRIHRINACGVRR